MLQKALLLMDVVILVIYFITKIQFYRLNPVLQHEKSYWNMPLKNVTISNAKINNIFLEILAGHTRKSFQNCPPFYAWVTCQKIKVLPMYFIEQIFHI